MSYAYETFSTDGVKSGKGFLSSSILRQSFLWLNPGLDFRSAAALKLQLSKKENLHFSWSQESILNIRVTMLFRNNASWTLSKAFAWHDTMTGTKLTGS